MSRSGVLVGDDDRSIAEVVSRYLERDGYAVEAVADGHAALDRPPADPRDLVVPDVMLPGLDGLEVCRRLRATPTVPVIMLTPMRRRRTSSPGSGEGWWPRVGRSRTRRAGSRT